MRKSSFLLCENILLLAAHKWQSLFPMPQLFKINTIMPKNAIEGKSVAEILNQHPYEYWKQLSYTSVLNVFQIIHKQGEGNVVKEELLDLLIDFKLIIDTHFDRYE